MELGYLRRLDLRTAGRVCFGERGRPADRHDEDREALEQIANVLDDLARNGSLSVEDRQTMMEATAKLMRAGY